MTYLLNMLNILNVLCWSLSPTKVYSLFLAQKFVSSTAQLRTYIAKDLIPLHAHKARFCGVKPTTRVRVFLWCAPTTGGTFLW